MLGCNLTLKQSQNNALLMLKRDCPVTQLLAPTVSLELALTCPCPGPSHRAKQELKTTPCTERIHFLADCSLTGVSPNVLFLQLMIFAFEICVSVFGTTRWMWSCPHSSSQQKPHELQQEQACFMAYSLEILYSTQHGFPKLDGINSIAVVFCQVSVEKPNTDMFSLQLVKMLKKNW